MSTALNDVIAKLVTDFAAAVDVTVYDGPTITDESKKSFVSVAWNADPEDLDSDFATVDNEWLYVGSMAKLETAQIVCGVYAWSGDKSPAARRQAAIDLYNDCDAYLRTAFKTDAAWQSLVRESVSVSGAVFSGGQRGTGNYTRGTFTVTYTAEI